MSELRSSNFHSTSSDVFSSRSGGSSEMSLTDALQAVVDKRMEPMLVYRQLPSELTGAIDASAQRVSQKTFADLPTEEQRTIFSALLKVFSKAEGGT